MPQMLIWVAGTIFCGANICADGQCASNICAKTDLDSTGEESRKFGRLRDDHSTRYRVFWESEQPDKIERPLRGQWTAEYGRLSFAALASSLRSRPPRHPIRCRVKRAATGP